MKIYLVALLVLNWWGEKRSITSRFLAELIDQWELSLHTTYLCIRGVFLAGSLLDPFLKTLMMPCADFTTRLTTLLGNFLLCTCLTHKTWASYREDHFIHVHGSKSTAWHLVDAHICWLNEWVKDWMNSFWQKKICFFH